MWSDTPPFDKLEVRQALKKVIDREAMIKTALFGYGDIGNDNPVPPSSPFAFASAPPPRDVEGAKALLAKAGYGPDNPLKFDLYTSDGTGGFVAMSQLFKEQAAEAGIEINVIVSPAGSYWDQVWLKQPFVFRPGTRGRRPRALRWSIARTWARTRPTSSGPTSTRCWTRPTWNLRRRQAHRAVQAGAEDPGRRGRRDHPDVYPQHLCPTRRGCTGFEPHIQITHIDFVNVSCPK